MKIVCLVHGYPPIQNAGAEWMLHEIMKYMVTKGHGVQVVLPVDIKPYNFEGVRVEQDSWKYTKEAVKEADIIISHLDRAGRALNVAEFYRKPFVQIIHNSHRIDMLNVKHRDIGGRFVYVIYNTLWLQKEMNYRAPGIVVHPPVDYKRYKIKKEGKKITLINLFEKKGGLFFNDLVKLMPDYEFLGVEGAYGKQEKTDLPNVTYMSNTPDAKDIYKETRILLMPSQYESYGRTGVEAMSQGIPVIANPTPGLKESLGDAGVFASIESPLKWVEAIKSLDNEKTYKDQSKKCIDRAKEIESGIESELKNMNVFFDNIINKQV